MSPAITPKFDRTVENAARPSPQSAEQARFASIDGLRGLACLMVLLYHSWSHFNLGHWPDIKIGTLDVRPAHLLGYGYGGVDLFFVLSGFCLAYPIVSKPNRAVDWKRYFLHRVRRILPAYWAALLLFAALSLLVTRHHWEPFFSQRVVGWPGVRQLGYSVLLISYAFNSSFWTLPVEWRWYFAFPLMIVAWRRVRGPGLLLGAALVGVAYFYGLRPMHLARVDFLVTWLPVFLPLFALGIYAAELCSSGSATRAARWLVHNAHWGIILSLPVVARYALWINAGPDADIANKLLPRLLVWGPLWFFVVLAATHDGPLKQITSWRPLVWVGLFSYSLYLIHEPLVRAASAVVLPLHWAPGAQLFFSEVLLPIVLIGFSYLFFLVAEKPFLRRPVKKAIENEMAPIAATSPPAVVTEA